MCCLKATNIQKTRKRGGGGIECLMVEWMSWLDGEGTLLFALLTLVVPSSVVYSEIPNPSSITEFLTG